MTNAQFYLLASALSVVALVRSRDAVALSLAIGFVVSVIAPGLRGWPEMLASVAVIDTVICVAMMCFWIARRCMRAWTIGFIGLGKVAVTLLVAWQEHGGFTYVGYSTYAFVINGAFLLQLIVAGGFVDAIGCWIDGVLRRVLPYRHSLLRNGDK